MFPSGMFESQAMPFLNKILLFLDPAQTALSA